MKEIRPFLVKHVFCYMLCCVDLFCECTVFYYSSFTLQECRRTCHLTYLIGKGVSVLSYICEMSMIYLVILLDLFWSN